MAYGAQFQIPHKIKAAFPRHHDIDNHQIKPHAGKAFACFISIRGHGDAETFFTQEAADQLPQPFIIINDNQNMGRGDETGYVLTWLVAGVTMNMRLQQVLCVRIKHFLHDGEKPISGGETCRFVGLAETTFLNRSQLGL